MTYKEELYYNEYIENSLNNKYNNEVQRLECMDSKNSSLLNVSILILTIKLSFVATIVSNVFFNIKFS